MINQLPQRLRDAARRQCGVVTTSQAAEAGLSRDAIRWRLRTRAWQRVHRGVYATFSGAPSREALLWAAVLHAGPGALLSHQTAAEVTGLADRPSQLVHVTIPADRRIGKEPGIAVHISARAREAVHPARLPPQTTIEETVLDLAAAAGTIDDAVGWITRGLGRRLTTAARLRQALTQRQRMRWRAALTELLSPDLAGLASVLERRYHRDVERPHGLPPAARQVRSVQGGRTAYRDLLYQAHGTCVELDGRLAHPAETRWRDIRRDNALAADGGVTLRYGWLEITARPCQTAAEVDRTLRRRGYAGAHPCGPACPVSRDAAHAQSRLGDLRRAAAGRRPRRGRPADSGAARPGRVPAVDSSLPGPRSPPARRRV